jgi:hypothetical protein
MYDQMWTNMQNNNLRFRRILCVIVQLSGLKSKKALREKRCKMRYKIQLFWKNYYDIRCKNSFICRFYWKDVTLYPSYVKKQITANFKIFIFAFFPIVECNKVCIQDRLFIFNNNMTKRKKICSGILLQLNL